VILSVGVTAADPLRLGEQIELLAEAGVRFLHVDVMDGRFCPQLTVGRRWSRRCLTASPRTCI